MYKKILILSIVFFINQPWFILDFFKSKETTYKELDAQLDNEISLYEYDPSLKHIKYRNDLNITLKKNKITDEQYTKLYNKHEKIIQTKKEKLSEEKLKQEEEEKKKKQK
jgi:alpha-galactosidase/6-phospho-beta-glucosidase family protein